jgi:hypothetical protein
MQQPIKLLRILKCFIYCKFEIQKQNEGAAVARISEVSVAQEYSVFDAVTFLLVAEGE